MAVTIHINGKSNSLVHKGSAGIAKSTIPDVCKTPTPGGPVPIPYPVIVSMSGDLNKGTKKVKVDGGNSAAVKGSEFSRCTGDEPGTVGGIKSSTNMKEATCTDCEGAADTIYHEVLHTEQPSSMSWEAKEMEAYTKTEEWTIKRGLAGNPSFRKIDAGGKVVPDTRAIFDMLHTEYPLGITNKSADGKQVKDNGKWRPSKEGDKIGGPQRLENVKKIDSSEFKCP